MRQTYINPISGAATDEEGAKNDPRFVLVESRSTLEAAERAWARGEGQ